jgi:FkbM family methyltransferase
MLSKLLRKQQISRWFNITLVTTVEGKRFKIPVFAKMGTGNYFMSELWMVDILKRVLPGTPGSFVDIGANTGQTLIKLRSVSSDIPYIGIEPNPSCVFYLRELIRQNRFRNCSIIPAGVFLENDLLKLTFLGDDDTDRSASLFSDGQLDPASVQSQFVPVLSFQLIRQRLRIDSICVIKIDVEGAELEVLQSLESTLHDLRPLLLLEILPVYQDTNVGRLERQNQVTALLTAQGYSLARIHKTASGRLASLHPMNEIGIHGDLALCDYLAYPVESGGSILSKFETV